jgi:hypothetical protein
MNKRSLVDIFEDNELKISILYKLYSQNIPGHKKFWKNISDEEVTHAKEIHKSLSKEKECLKENKFSRGIINYINSFVEEKIKEAKNKKLSHAEAINNALRIEQSMLEEKCFDIFIPRDRTAKEVLEKLNKDTRKHVEQLRKEF